jgi:hypothetical protein
MVQPPIDWKSRLAPTAPWRFVCLAPRPKLPPMTNVAVHRKVTPSNPMKTKALLLGLVLASPLALFAAPNDAMLLMGKCIGSESGTTVATGAATAIIGDLNVSADSIIFDQQKRLLTCTGDVTIRSAGRTVKSQDATIEVGVAVNVVYTLNKNGIVIPSSKTGEPSNDPKEQFSRRLPKLELRLSPERL